MSGQMCWLSSSGYEGQLILHLRERSFEPRLPYTAYPQLMVADYPIADGSKGFSTCQKRAASRVDVNSHYSSTKIPTQFG